MAVLVICPSVLHSNLNSPLVPSQKLAINLRSVVRPQVLFISETQEAGGTGGKDLKCARFPKGTCSRRHPPLLFSIVQRGLKEFPNVTISGPRFSVTACKCEKEGGFPALSSVIYTPFLLYRQGVWDPGKLRWFPGIVAGTPPLSLYPELPPSRQAFCSSLARSLCSYSEW